jgi:hypothetical protein
MLTSSLVVLEVVVAGEQADYIAFCEEICPEWDYLHIAVGCNPSLYKFKIMHRNTGNFDICVVFEQG